MNINRHNYEEYFILYLDNELSEPERRMVEDFVQLHPDLQDELDILLQYKLEPDTQIVFEGKEDLLKENGHSLVTPNNYPEWLTLYNDQELTADQRASVEAFLATHPAAAKEQSLLLQARLEPETIVYPFKNALYRKEERVRRIAPVYWRAAAAVLILLAGLGIVLNLNNRRQATDSDMAVKVPADTGTPDRAPVQPEPGKLIEPAVKESPSGSTLLANTGNTAPDAADRKKEKELAQKAPLRATDPPVRLSPDPEMTGAPSLANHANQPSNNLPLPKENPYVTGLSRNSDALASNNSPVNNTLSINPDPAVTTRSPQPSDIVQASYNENAETLEQPDGKKNKNRGFFRKIARTFEKRTNMDPTDDNRLLVAGLSIKLK